MGIVGRGLELNPQNGIVYPIFESELPENVINNQIVVITSNIVPKVIYGVECPSDITGYNQYTVFIPIINSLNKSFNISYNNNIEINIGFGESKMLVSSEWVHVDSYVGIDDSWVKFGYGGNDINTVLLMDFEDTIIKDSSVYALSGVLNGNAVLNTTYKKFGNSSGNFVDSSSVEFNDSTNFNFGINDFTIDWWEYRTSTPTVGEGICSSIDKSIILGFAETASNTSDITYYASSDGVNWDIADGIKMGNCILNQWVHRALVRKNGVFIAFQNGVKISSYSNNLSPLFNIISGFKVGQSNSLSCNCYLDEFRVSNNARWYNNFIPPNTPYTK